MLKKILLFLFASCTLFVYGQNAELKGTVVDDASEPVIGATILIKGTTKGTVSDIDGNFAIEVSPNQTLLFSGVGMISKEVVYTGQADIQVVLKSNDKMLEDVVVIGYQTIKKADLTGSVAVFNPNVMKNTTVTGTVGDALGTLPGLNVRTSGAPGKEGKIVIRGTGTFGNGDPLYVVDGVVSGANRDFNFNDIESIQVLKDASAAAIYGSRAGNGVIIITTKQGAEGKMKIDVSSRMTAQWLPKYNLTGRDEWINLNDMAFKNAISDENEHVKKLANHFNGNTDWQKETFKTGWIQDHNLSISGGGKESRYFISGNYQSNSGTTVGSNSERFTLRSNTSASRSFGELLTMRIGENIALSNYSVDELNTNPITDVYRMLPTIPLYDKNNRGGYGFGNGDKDVTFGTNPLAKEEFENGTNTNLRVRGNVFTEAELMKTFKYKFNLGFDMSNDKHNFLRKEGDWTYNQPYDPSYLRQNQAQSRGLVFDNTFEFNKKVGKHDFSAVVGTSFQTTSYERLEAVKTNVIETESGHLEQMDGVFKVTSIRGYKEVEKLFSVFGRANYNYDEKYLLSFTMRRDQSSKFNPKHNTGYFPSISGGWRISNESFFPKTVFDELKLRANYGILGTSNIGHYDWMQVMNLFPQVAFGNNVYDGVTQTELTNEDLKWEKLTQLNVGFDANLLKNRLQISFDYFNKETKDVLTPMPILMSTGHSGPNNRPYPYVNAATLQNSGVELSVTWRDKIGSDWGYNVNVNGSYLQNEIKELGYGRNGFIEWNTKSLVGQSIGEWYLIKTNGIFKSDAEVKAHKNSKGDLIQKDAKPGDIRYIDYNDDGQITDADRQHVGSSTPKFQLGMNFGIDYKGFDLQLQFSGAFGHKLFNGPRSGYDRFDDNSNYRKDYDPWTPENPNAKDPRPLYKDSRNARTDQDRWLENGSYLKLKQLAIGYSFPKTILGKNINNLRLFANAQNLLTLTAYKGLDPEFLNTNIWMRGFDDGSFPNPYGVTFGAQITF